MSTSGSANTGGGGGGYAEDSINFQNFGGGGGAGGYRCSVPGENSGGGASAESVLTVTGSTPYTITVGGGGAGSPVIASTPSTTAGGSGVVITKQPAVEVTIASGVWSIDAVYENVKAGTWV